MRFHERILLENRAWAGEMHRRNPRYFEHLKNGQSPEAFWISCSDSRVPVEQMCNSSPGDLFMHRNVANLVATEDPAFMSALEYAVSILEVGNIIVCGHEDCGGIGAACSTSPTGLKYLDTHIAPLVRHVERERETLAAEPDHASRVNAMVRLNIVAQVDRLTEMEIVRQARVSPVIVGLIYKVDTGALEFVCEREVSDTALAAAANA
ncbi:MAG: carbonic anhydrase [Salinisphaeraceae bacterium]